MSHPRLFRSPLVAVLATTASLLLIASCQDDSPLGPDRLGPLFSQHGGGDQLLRFGTGNSEFFFLSPLSGDVTEFASYGENPGNTDLVPRIRICRLGEVVEGQTEALALKGPDQCDDVTGAVTGAGNDLGIPMANDGDGFYSANFHTRDLDPAQAYRIEVWGLPFTTAQRGMVLDTDDRWLFGWRNIRQSPSTASCNDDGTGGVADDGFCLTNFGQNLPVKVLIQQFVFCPGRDPANPDGPKTGEGENCSVVFVRPDADANLTAPLGDGVFGQLQVPAQNEGDGFFLAFQACDPDEEGLVDGATDLPTFGPCVKTVLPPTLGEEVELLPNEPAIVGFCTEFKLTDAEKERLQGHSQEERITLHHFSTAGSDPTDPKITRVDAWPHADPNCPEAQQSQSASRTVPESGLARFAHLVGERLTSWLRPQPLHARARARRLDIGAGGQGFDLRSFWKLALPTAFEEDQGQSPSRDSEGLGTVQVRVADVGGSPVADAWVTLYRPGPEGWAEVGQAPTEFDGIARFEGLPLSDGPNLFRAEGNGLAGPGPDPCVLLPVGAEEPGACSGPRTGADPFHPFPLVDVDDPGETVRLARGFIEFSVDPCQTPQVDGTLDEGEWDCAESRTFPVSLSGGSAMATLYWMNDGDNFYIAVAVPGTDRQNSLRIEWHRNASGPSGTIDQNGFFTGARALGADVWEVHPGSSPVARDMFIDNQCSGSSQTNCGQLDSAWGGSNGTVAAFSNQNGMTVYELSHPLNSGETCNGGRAGSRGCHGYTGLIDLSAASGDTRGFFLSLRMGSGAQGNTVWPGFLQYLAVEIK
jgi:hypothetical protein